MIGRIASLMSFLDAATQLLIKETHPAIRVARTLILYDLAVGGLQEEGGKALNGFTLCGFGVLRRVDHQDLARLATHLDCAALGKLSELRFYRLAVRAPVSVVHGEGVHRRGRTRLEALESITERGAETIKIDKAQDANNNCRQ